MSTTRCKIITTRSRL